MRKALEIYIEDTSELVKKMVYWGSKSKDFILLNSNKLKVGSHSYSRYDLLASYGMAKSMAENAENSFSSLKKFHQEHKDWLFGFFSYDLKNQLENLTSENPDYIEFPDIFFYVPEIVFLMKDKTLRIEYLENRYSQENVYLLYNSIQSETLPHANERMQVPGPKQRFTFKDYIETIEQIKRHIQSGDIYEINLCQEFYCENIDLNPYEIYLRLNEISPAPFSVFLVHQGKFLICSSPERFLANRGGKIISQPIKGTARRSRNPAEDMMIKTELSRNRKERAENIMITDLVRNDLARTSKTGSVTVEELCRVYSYKQVHQMISTIISEFDDQRYDIIDVIEKAFPMGSMTGAPKIRAMELIEKYEKTKRGLYSGAVGYISPEKDFDFNVVIRSILYNQHNKYLSFIVGSAITFQSEADKEYEECQLKAKALKMALLTDK
jgi:para-aminobenzoate synthetase component I